MWQENCRSLVMLVSKAELEQVRCFVWGGENWGSFLIVLHAWERIVSEKIQTNGCSTNFVKSPIKMDVERTRLSK